MEHGGKSEIRISKSETNSNFQNPNEQNLQLRGPRLNCLEHWNIRISDLFRASYFEFDIQPPLCGLTSDPIYFELRELLTSRDICNGTGVCTTDHNKGNKARYTLPPWTRDESPWPQ